MHSVKRILTTENRTCAIRPTAIQPLSHPGLVTTELVLRAGLITSKTAVSGCSA